MAEKNRGCGAWGHVAWAQILGHVEVSRDGAFERMPYWTTGIFHVGTRWWHGVYWGGAEPQENPRACCPRMHTTALAV